MKPKLIILLSLAAVGTSVGLLYNPASPSVATGAEESPPTFRVAGIMVNAPVANETEMFPETAFFGSFERTRIAVQLDVPEGGIVDLRRDDSTLQMFSDDKGRDLLPQESTDNAFEMSPRRLEDGRRLLFVLASKRLPHPDARELTVRGEAAVLVSEGTETASANNVALAPGSKTTVGPYEFEVTETGESEWAEGWSFTLSSSQDLSTIVSYSLVDDDGAEYELSTSWSVWGNGNWQQSLVCKKPVEKATLVVEYWKSPEVRRIPFELSCGMGLR